MSNLLDPNYGITALVYGLIILAVVAIAAMVLTSRGGELRGEIDRTTTGSIHMKGEIKGPPGRVPSSDR